MIKALFLDHPRAVGETYFEHLTMALGFGLMMIIAGMACLIHAVVPSLFVTTASDAVKRLNETLVLSRRDKIRRKKSVTRTDAGE